MKYGHRYFLGLDDTDNLLSRGTGFRARELGKLLGEQEDVLVTGITRHQLLVDPRIPYTSHNSSACIDFYMPESMSEGISRLAEEYLLESSAQGSDSGLCIVREDRVDEKIIRFGRKAKESVVTADEALSAGKGSVTVHKGLTGDGGGIIGAIAAAGLRAEGNDGRFIWTKNLRELTGVHTAKEVLESTGIDVILNLSGGHVSGNELVNTDPWPRPVLMDGKAVLLVERNKEVNGYDWGILGKEYIRRF